MRKPAEQGSGRGLQVSTIREPHPVAYQRVGGLIELPALLRELGCDPEEVISGAGVDPEALTHIDHKFPYAQAARLVGACARHTGCPHLDQGTTFQRILDEVRYEVARQLLGNTEMPIPDIAAALCYSEVSAFTHAFGRWTGASPHRWRTGAERS